jgi:hypothetical protein
MANRIECDLPNGDCLVADYDGESLMIQVGAGRKVVFSKRFTNHDLTGDDCFREKPPEEEPHYFPRNGRVANGVHLGPDE